MKYVLERQQVVPRNPGAVFGFFADAHNLEKLTPASLHFRIETPGPIAMFAGTIIDYRISLMGIGWHWRTLIEDFDPPDRFTDVQTTGPYRSWRHVHEFLPVPQGTLLRDRVEYQMPLGPLGELAHRVFVRAELDRIFDYRREVIDRTFGTVSARSPV